MFYSRLIFSNILFFSWWAIITYSLSITIYLCTPFLSWRIKFCPHIRIRMIHIQFSVSCLFKWLTLHVNYERWNWTHANSANANWEPWMTMTMRRRRKRSRNVYIIQLISWINATFLEVYVYVFKGSQHKHTTNSRFFEVAESCHSIITGKKVLCRKCPSRLASRENGYLLLERPEVCRHYSKIDKIKRLLLAWIFTIFS